MKPRNTSVSLIEVDGHLHVWNASFTLTGTLARKDGRVDEADRKRLQAAIGKAIAAVNFSLQHSEIDAVDFDMQREQLAAAIANDYYSLID